MTRFFAASMLAVLTAGGSFASGLGAAEVAEKAPSAKPGDASVPVKVVMLFSSGVGYFEHIGPVTGNASSELQFKTTQINDILKSLVLEDTGGGKVGTIVYPSQDPISKILKSFQVDIANNPPLAELLNQLRGAKLKVTLRTAEGIAGTILGAEKKPKAVGDKGSIEVWVLNLVSGGTITSVGLDDVAKLELVDPQLQEELTKALAALAQSRDQEKKTVTLHFQGQGERTVRIGYVVETPVWKTSYRLVLAAKPEEKNNLQGWAIVENQTDNDWNDVRLSLVSGRPISFIEELYQPLYIPRPVVQPNLYASLRPQTYEGGIQEESRLRETLTPPVAAGRAAVPNGRGGMGAAGTTAALADRQLERQMDITASVASIASAAEMGGLFQYTVGDVSLPRQRSAMIPIITDPIEVERVSIYNQSVLARNALNGARIKNTTKKHLLQGPITVFDGGSYAGDASINNVPPDQTRLLSYGIDLQTLVDASSNKQESSIVAGKIVKGVLNVQNKQVFTQTYVIQNDDDKDKSVIVEHPRRPNWQLVDSPAPFETTDTLYRFKQVVPAGKKVDLTVKEELAVWSKAQILSIDSVTLDFYTKSGSIPQAVKDALAKAAELKRKVSDTQSQITQLQTQRQQIVQDQARVREDIKAVEQGAYKTRMMGKLEEQEKQIDEIDKSVDAAQKAIEKQRKELDDYLVSLDVG